jgi:hypothetical protein
MVKLNVTAGTNINHIRRSINAQEIQSPLSTPAQEQQNSLNSSTLLAQSLGDYQSRLGFLQAYEQNLAKLELAQEALQQPMEKDAFKKQLEGMMDIVDNTIYTGQSLFGKGIEYGLEIGTLEGIESSQDVQNLGENIAQLRQKVNQNIQKTSIALINTLSALGTQNPPENERENHTGQLERIHSLLKEF